LPPVAITDSLGYYHVEIPRAKSCLVAYVDGYEMQKQCALDTYSLQRIDFKLSETVITIDDPPNEEDTPTDDPDIVTDPNTTTGTASIGGSVDIALLAAIGLGMYLLFGTKKK